MRRNLRTTRLEEAEIALQKALAEGNRLRNMLDSVMQNPGGAINNMNQASSQSHDLRIQQMLQQMQIMNQEKQQFSQIIANKDKEITLLRQRQASKSGKKVIGGTEQPSHRENFNKELVHQLEIKIEENQLQYDQLKASNGLLESEIMSLKLKAKMSEDQLSSLEQSSKNEGQQFKKQIEDLTSKAQKDQEKLKSEFIEQLTKKDKEALESLNKQKKELSEMMSKQKKELEQQVVLKDQEFSQLVVKQKEQIQELMNKKQEELKGVSSQKEKIEEEMKKIIASRAKMEEDFKAVASLKEKIDEELKKMTAKNQKMEEEIKGVTSQKEKMEQEMKKRLEEAKSSISNQQRGESDVINQKNQEIEKLTNKREKQKKKKWTLIQQIQTIQTENKDLKDQISQLKNKEISVQESGSNDISSLQVQLNEKSQQIKSLEEEKNSYEQNMARMGDENAAYKKQVSSIKQQILLKEQEANNDNADDEKYQLEQDLITEKEEKEELKLKLKGLEDQSAKLQKQISLHSSQLEDRDNQISTLTIQIEELKKTIEQQKQVKPQKVQNEAEFDIDKICSLPTVKDKDVDPIFEKIKIFLVENKIMRGDLELHLFGPRKNRASVGQTSVKDLALMLQNKYKLDLKEAVLISRYVIEDGEEDTVEYDPNIQMNNVKIFKILVDNIPKYELMINTKTQLQNLVKISTLRQVIGTQQTLKNQKFSHCSSLESLERMKSDDSLDLIPRVTYSEVQNALSSIKRYLQLSKVEHADLFQYLFGNKQGGATNIQEFSRLLNEKIKIKNEEALLVSRFIIEQRLDEIDGKRPPTKICFDEKLSMSNQNIVEELLLKVILIDFYFLDQ